MTLAARVTNCSAFSLPRLSLLMADTERALGRRLQGDAEHLFICDKREDKLKGQQ